MSDLDIRIVELHRSGLRPVEIEAETGMSRQMIVATLQRLGEKTRKPEESYHNRGHKTDKARALWEQGLSTSAIAERLGIAQATVIKMLTIAGIDLMADGKRTRYNGVPGFVGRPGSGGAFARFARRT